ncbi:unnamed protein product [Rhizoctonia solani]|uniref:Fungal-specific transcription factor domain protein n=1 Tax=Rhizoctonia solani TaxID=456999 RepID=A0A8H3CRA5_9AGAM|nr:unnamed protein product [Rhizoctonia solani]
MTSIQSTTDYFTPEADTPVASVGESNDQALLSPFDGLDSNPVLSPSNEGEVAPTVFDRISSPKALFSDFQAQGVDLSSQSPRPTVNPEVPLVPNRSTHGIAQQDGTPKHGEGVISVIHRELVLDKTAQSNALPFVLQGYGAWINRVALDPLKLTSISRNFVCSHFGDGDESRWILALLANIGSRIGSVELVEGKPDFMLSMLQTAVRRRLETANNGRITLVKALDSAVEAMMIHFHVSPISDTMTLMYEAAPIFGQLCSDPPGTPINLLSLLQQPLGSLWHYAFIDILFGVTTDTPTLFRYEASIASYQHPNLYRESQGDSMIQWLRGVPSQLILAFAHMRSIREDGRTPDESTVTLLERAIHELPPFNGSSSDRFLAVMRSVVQECWKQAAFIYLYMGVCGESSDTPRVKNVFQRYMRLLNGTKPGRLPDEFLIVTLQLISPAAQRQRDREVLKQRALKLYTRDRTHLATTFILFVMGDVWTRADAEGRPIMWSDVAVSRKRLLGA